MADINVGFGKKSNVLLTGFKAGLKKESLKTEQEKSVFDAIDKDKNGVLDENEVQNFTKALDSSNDGQISKKEAKAFLKENNLDLNKKEVLNFLKSNVQNTENVESAKVVEQNGSKLVQVTYKDGTIETINPDKSSQIATKDADGNLKTQYKDENGVLTRDTIEKKDGDKTVSTIETEYAQDGSTPVKSTERDFNNGSVATISYKDGKPETKEVKQGSTTSNYTYNADGSEVLNSKVENEGIPAKEKRTEYTYNEDGTTTENITEPGLNRKTTRTVSKEGVVEDIVDGNGTKTHNTYNAENKRLTQTKTVEGKEYTIQYDGKGNTPGVVVQNGENLEIIAKKFGVTVEDLKNANAEVLNGKNEFSVGDEIKIPTEVEADDKNIQGRKSPEEAKAEYKKEQEIKRKKEEQAALRRQQQQAQAAARRAQAAAQEAQYKAMGLKNHKGQGKPIVGTYKGGKKEEFSIIGEAGYGRHLARSKTSGKVVTIAHDGVILKDSYVQATNLYGSGKKIQGKIKDKTGKLVTRNYVEIPGAKLPHGRKAVVDEKGRTWIMAHDGVILDNNYVAQSNAADAIRKDSKTAQKAAIGMLESELNSAQKAFDAQMDKDGWAADVADGVSNLWGWAQKDGNQAWRVRRDLKTYRSQLNELKVAASKGDAQFRAKFKQIYGIEYNQNAIANYTMHPTEANYKKAFGTKNDIGARVAKYNDSQDQGAAVVKTTAEVGAAIALTAATVATGGAAGVVAGAAVAAGTTMVADVVIETTDRMSSHNGLQDGEMTEIMQGATTDGLIAGVTFGASKYAKTAYKAGKAVYAASKTTTAATRATVVAEKVATKAEGVATKALAATEKSSQKALGAAATKAETTVAKAETAVTKAESSVAKAETQVAKVETQTAAKSAPSVGLSKTEDAVIDTVTDGVVGATSEYIETGDVSIEGTVTNMAVGSVGIVGSKVKGSKIYQKVKDGVSDAYHGAKSKVGDAVHNAKSKIKGASTPEAGMGRSSDVHNSTHTESSHSTKGNAETHNKTNTENNTKTENRTNADNNTNSANTENSVHSETKSESKTSTEKLNERMNKLESSIQEGEFAQKIKDDYSDILDTNYKFDLNNKDDVNKLRNELRALVKDVHPDRGGSTEISQVANQIYSDLRNKDANKIKQSLAELNNMLSDKTKNLTRQKAEFNQLKSMYGSTSTTSAKQANQSSGVSATQNASQSQNASSKKNFENLSDEISSTFSNETQEKLSKLKVGQDVMLTKNGKCYVIKNINGHVEIKTSLDANELVRVKGNEGKVIDKNYVKTSSEAREYLQDAIASGQYTESFESYVNTMNKMHKISAAGKNGNNEWYSAAGNGHNAVNPGQIRGNGAMVNHRTGTAIEAENIAVKYGDSYKVSTPESKVKLKGIPTEYQPTDLYINGEHAHVYPDGASMGYYYKEMHRTSKEALQLINNGASEQAILKKVAEHYQYAANARPYGQINNSLFMNEINTLLQKAGLKTIPHGNLDQISMHLQPETFQKYFIDQYYQTALS